MFPFTLLLIKEIKNLLLCQNYIIKVKIIVIYRQNIIFTLNNLPLSITNSQINLIKKNKTDFIYLLYS